MVVILTLEFDQVHTKQWWESLLADENKMNAWLSKLWQTEKGGYDGNIRSAEKYAPDDGSVRNVFLRIADEELSHSNLLLSILNARGIDPTDTKPPNSKYWPHVMKGISDLKSSAAASAVGEKLAALRFEFLLNHPGTPDDIKGFLEKALPEEQGHFRDLSGIAGQEAVDAAVARHNEAVQIITTSRPQ